MRLSIRWKLMVGVALPLVALLAWLLWQSFVTRRADALEQQKLVLSRETALLAGRLDGELRAMRQIAEFNAWLASFVEISERDIYALLIDTLERNPLIHSGRIAFAPGQGPPGSDRAAFYVYRNPTRGVDGRDPYLGGNLALEYDHTDASVPWYWLAQQEGVPIWTEPYVEEEPKLASSIIDMPDFSKGWDYLISRMAPWIGTGARPLGKAATARGEGGRPAAEVPATPQYAAISSICVPFQRNGRFGGVATIDVRLADLGRVVAGVNQQNAWLAILSPEGRLVYWPEHRLIMHQTFRTLATGTGRPGLVDVGLRMMSGESGTTIMPDLEPTEATYLVAYTPIPAARWSLAAALPEREVMEPVYLALRDRAISAASVLGLVTLTVLAIGAWLTRPIKRLAQGVIAMEQSDNFEAPPVRVRTDDEIGDLAKSYNRMVRQIKKRVQELTEAKRAEEKVLSELRVAREIQASLLPELDPAIVSRAEYELFAINAPARSVAGDFYDFFVLQDGRLAIVIADVSGKGVPASLFMAVARTVVRDLASRGEPPGRVLTEANARLLADNRFGMFVTLFVGYYDPRTGALTYANGGHLAPCVVGPRGVRQIGMATGTVVGVFPSETWYAAESAIAPGETVVLYTDGLPEARRADGTFFGEDRVRDRLQLLSDKSPADLCAALTLEIDQWQEAVRADDVTILVLHRRE